MMTQLSQANLAANARMDRFEARMDRLETRMDEFHKDMQAIISTLSDLVESNRRAIGFRTTED